ncbi:MAG TPA: response regulator transcription factor [Bryobacteraceae bacterium]|nr:response regulator transcription factor [Bryobacteraceae bacterium]
MIRVAVASRSSIVRAGLESIVRSSESLELVGALEWRLLRSAELDADVLLVDAGEPQPDYLRAMAEELSLPVVLLVESPDMALTNAALRAGIRAILPADATPQAIEGAIQAVYAGLVVVTPGSLPMAVREAPPIAEALTEPLSDRELEVLEALVEGLSNKLIAHRLEISEHTVKTHVASILTKFGASSRTEAVSMAIRRRLVML